MTERITAQAQIGLAFFYGLIFAGMFAVIVICWETIGKVEVGLLSMFATGALGQSKDAASYFFARQRNPGETP
jgi:hypothetical protein